MAHRTIFAWSRRHLKKLTTTKKYPTKPVTQTSASVAGSSRATAIDLTSSQAPAPAPILPPPPRRRKDRLDPSKNLTTFHPFSRLPQELQIYIFTLDAQSTLFPPGEIHGPKVPGQGYRQRATQHLTLASTLRIAPDALFLRMNFPCRLDYCNIIHLPTLLKVSMLARDVTLGVMKRNLVGWAAAEHRLREEDDGNREVKLIDFTYQRDAEKECVCKK